MGKIDKEKLLKEIDSKIIEHGPVSVFLYDIIKNFPEEQEQPIDFNALYDEWAKLTDDDMPYAQSYNSFLRSKNLTAPKPVEIPVKKTWTLKKEYQEAFKNFDFSFNRVLSFESEPAARRIKYYDLHEELDYSKIPKGSIVVVSSKDDKIKSAEIVDHFDSNYIYCNGGVRYELKYAKIRIVELAKE